MTPRLTLYSRRDCCLCDEMKAVIRQVTEGTSVRVEEIDIDSSAELRHRYDREVPVLMIDGRKAFKFRVTAKELKKRLRGARGVRGFISRRFSWG